MNKEKMIPNYYFILMSQKDFLENQVVEEILRERANYYTSKGRIKDFWIINSPTFIQQEKIQSQLKTSNFYKQKLTKITSVLTNSTAEFYTALVTCDFEFIKWVQLRIGYFEDIANITNLNNSYISDGLFGKIEGNDFPPLSISSEYLHPDILVDRYKKSIEIYYKMI